MNYYFTDELYHYGIKGQKWGVRRMFGYDRKRSDMRSASRYSGDQRKRAADLDVKYNKYRSSQTAGKHAVKNLLLGSSGKRTYDMARASGEGRVKSGARSLFDINAGTILGSVGGIAAGSYAANILGNDLNPVKQKKKQTAIRAIATIGGTLIGDLIANSANKSGSNISLQQRAIMKKAAKGKKQKKVKSKK